MENQRGSKNFTSYPDRRGKELCALSRQLKTGVNYKVEHCEVKESSAIHTNRPEFYLGSFIWFLGVLSFGSALFGRGFTAASALLFQ